jgi:predicted kinase
MNPIFLVVGPPAVGKSTTSRLLAAQFLKSLHIPVDDIRNMVVSGLLLPAAHWSEDLTIQVALARKSVAQIAINYHEAGYAVVIDDFWDNDHLSDYQALLDHPGLHKVVLLPSQETAHQRNLRRSGESPARVFIDEGIQIVYQQLHSDVPQLLQQGWVVVDSTSLSADETVATILQQCVIEGL